MPLQRLGAVGGYPTMIHPGDRLASRILFLSALVGLMCDAGWTDMGPRPKVPAGGIPSDGNMPHVSITVYAPPALVVVIDDKKRRAGVDLSQPVDAYGQGTMIRDIPETIVDPMNTSSDEGPDAGKPAPTTGWCVVVHTWTATGLEVELHGVAEAAALVILDGFRRRRSDEAIPTTLLRGNRVWLWTPRSELPVFVRQGEVTRVHVAFDPLGPSVIPAREVSSEQLAKDIQTACDLMLIEPAGVCQSLEAKVSSGSWQALLNELAAQDGKHVKEPATTILKEEATALLSSRKRRGTLDSVKRRR